MASPTAIIVPGGVQTNDGQGSILNWTLGLDPNGSGRLEVLVAPPGQIPANILYCEQITAGRASAKFVDQGGTSWVLTDPNTGFITWAG